MNETSLPTTNRQLDNSTNCGKDKRTFLRFFGAMLQKGNVVDVRILHEAK